MTSGLPRPSECRDCADPIRFVEMPTGRQVPVNPLPNRDRGGIVARLTMGAKGRELRGYALSTERGPDPTFPLRFTVHHATCKSRPRRAPAAPAPAPAIEADAPLF